MIEVVTKGPAETMNLGRKIGALLKANDVLAISGELGAGKTTLIKGLAEELGIREFVSSPSFIIINEYSGRLPFYHVDLYRLEAAHDVEDIALADYFKKGGVCAVEWAEKMGTLLPSKYIRISIEPGEDNERKISISEIGTDRLGSAFPKG